MEDRHANEGPPRLARSLFTLFSWVSRWPLSLALQGRDETWGQLCTLSPTWPRACRRPSPRLPSRGLWLRYGRGVEGKALSYVSCLLHALYQKNLQK